MKIKKGFVLREAAGSFVVMNLGSETDFNGMITLNETGALIWNNIDQGKSTEEIAKNIIEEYDIDFDTAFKDTVKFIIKMSEAGVIEQED